MHEVTHHYINRTFSRTKNCTLHRILNTKWPTKISFKAKQNRTLIRTRTTVIFLIGTRSRLRTLFTFQTAPASAPAPWFLRCNRTCTSTRTAP